MSKNNEKTTTAEVFEPLYGRSLTKEETFLIDRNLVSFFNLLIKIEQKSKKGILK